MSRLDDIEAREKAATPGPWASQVYGGDVGDSCVVAGTGPKTFVAVDLNEADAHFIAHARADVPWLVARVRKLEAALRQAVDGHEAEGAPEKYTAPLRAALEEP